MINITRADNLPSSIKNMKAKKTYYLDKDGNVTTDQTKGEIRITREGAFIPPHIAVRYGFQDGEIKAEKAKANKSAAPSENKKEKK